MGGKGPKRRCDVGDGGGGGGVCEVERRKRRRSCWTDTEGPMESKHETFCIVPHQTTETWDHVNSQSVCLLPCCPQLIGPTVNVPVLTVKKNKRDNMKCVIPWDTGGLRSYLNLRGEKNRPKKRQKKSKKKKNKNSHVDSVSLKGRQCVPGEKRFNT